MASSAPLPRLDKDNCAVLLVDHQTGLLSLVRDINPDTFKTNVLATCKVAQSFFKPSDVILTTSFESGPNGPILPEIRAMFPDSPFIARPGQINAWDNEDFVKAIKATGKKQLLIAGVVTEVCVAFPVLSAVAAGYDVFVITDASGTFNQITRDAAWMRMVHAKGPGSCQLISWFAMACELHRDWRNGVEVLGGILASGISDYANLINSHTYFTAEKK